MSHDLVHIYMPRLDVTFKKGPVPEARGNITPIRFHWLQFVRNLFDTYIESGIETCVYEMPLWLRRFTYHKIKEHYDNQNKEMEKAKGKNSKMKEVIGKDGLVKSPEFLKKTSYK